MLGFGPIASTPTSALAAPSVYVPGYPIVNDRDVLLQAAEVRTLPPANRALLLGCSSPGGFKVAADNTASPAEIVFTPVLLGMAGAVSFAATEGLTLTTAGNVATLTFANMSVESGTVTASIVADGEIFSQPISISKVRDGAAGAATTLYTWIRFADDIYGAGISNDPTGKTHIGFAYNKTSATESNVPGDYAWSLYKGGDGVPGEPGADGTPRFMWVKYSDNPDGTGLYDEPTSNTIYIGIAPNKLTATESTAKADYTWSRLKGEQGVPGPAGSGSRGAGWYYATGSSWSDIIADASTPGANVLGDQVTIADGTVSYTKRWDGDSWEQVGSFLGGDLFVEKSINASKIRGNGLELLDLSGGVILKAGVALNPAYAAAGTVNNDLVPSINSAAATANWPNVSGTGRPADNATVGAPTGTQVAGVNAGTVAANAAAGNAAYDALPGVNADIATRLKRDAYNTLTGQVALKSSMALLVGTTLNGIWIGTDGLYCVEGGVVKASIPITGSPTFAGELLAAFGTLGQLRIAANGCVFGGDYTGYSWPASGGVGFALSSDGALFGNFNDGRFLQLYANGDVKAPDFTIIAGVATFSGKLGNVMGLAITDNVPSSRGNPNGATINCGSLTVNISGGRAPFQIQWSIASFSDSPEWGDTHVSIEGADTATVTLKVKTRNDTSVYVALACTVIDADGKTATKSSPQNIQFGTPT